MVMTRQQSLPHINIAQSVSHMDPVVPRLVPMKGTASNRAD